MPTDEEKAAILEHIRYEIVRCFGFEEGEQALSEYWIAHMVHARVLLEFFESDGKKARTDDVLCIHFGFPASKVDLDSEHWMRFNKDVHHLSYARLRHTTDTKGWNIVDVLLPLRVRAISFIEHILAQPPTKAKPDEITQWKMLHAGLNAKP